MTHVALVIALLGRTDLFRSLTETDYRMIAERMHEATYESGQLIFSRGDPGDEMHLVVEGRVRLFLLSADGKVLSFSHATRGDVFGEIATLDGQARTADATALTDVTTMVLKRSSLSRMIETRPQLAQAAISFVCHRLRATSDQIESIALHSAEVRVARFLLAAVTLKGEPKRSSQSVSLELGMSQTELGLLLGASRSKINEALSGLENRGAIRRVSGMIQCHVAVLEGLTQGE